MQTSKRPFSFSVSIFFHEDGRNEISCVVLPHRGLVPRHEMPLTREGGFGPDTEPEDGTVRAHPTRGPAPREAGGGRAGAGVLEAGVLCSSGLMLGAAVGFHSTMRHPIKCFRVSIFQMHVGYFQWKTVKASKTREEFFASHLPAANSF